MQRKPIRTTPAMAKAAKMAAAATKKKQSLAITMNGETPISNDDFDGAGYNMDGIWDWSERRFRQNAVKPHTYFEDLGLDMPTCEPNESALKAEVRPVPSWPDVLRTRSTGRRTRRGGNTPPCAGLSLTGRLGPRCSNSAVRTRIHDGNAPRMTFATRGGAGSIAGVHGMPLTGS